MKYVKIKEIKSVKSEPVYHITVEKNHNFFANKLCVHNCDYTGEIKVILANFGDENFTVYPSDRIAQCVLAPALTKNIVNLNKVEIINKTTDRNSGGFGSTGIK